MQAALYLGGETWHLLVRDSTGRPVVDVLRLAAFEGGDAMEEADLALCLYGLSRQGELVRGPFATQAEATEVFYREDAGAAVEAWSEAQLTAWCRPRCPNCGALGHHLDQCER
jgi:hypothetical protein